MCEQILGKKNTFISIIVRYQMRVALKALFRAAIAKMPESGSTCCNTVTAITTPVAADPVMKPFLVQHSRFRPKFNYFFISYMAFFN